MNVLHSQKLTAVLELKQKNNTNLIGRGKLMKKFFVTGLIAALAVQAQAQSSESKEKAESAVKLEEVKPAGVVLQSGEQDVDEVITNRKLRADTGAKKTFSFSANLNYSGGSIEKPGSENRPNIRATKATQTIARLTGTVGVKAKLSPLQSLSANIGVGIDKPFHSDDKSFGERSSASDPSLTYQVLAKLKGIQSVTQISASMGTSDFNRAIGLSHGAGLTEILAYDFGGSKFTLGSLIQMNAFFYDKSTTAVTTYNNKTFVVGGQQGDFSAGIYPFAEYVISDRLNIRTISGVWAYDHARTQSEFWTWEKNKIYQSVGLGISVTRDIYLYPNVQFLPEKIRSHLTNVALNATINL